MRVKEWEGDVVFLHEVGQGRGRPLLRHPGGAARRPAGRGGGARQGRAGTSWRRGEQSGKADRLVDDLPLFSAAMRREAAPPKPDLLGEALAALNPDEMTPREALEALYRLKHVATQERS